MSEAMIQADGLVKIYKTKQTEVLALQGLDLTVEAGELTALIGNSGSGKSTFLNMIGGLDRPSAGSLTVCGKNLFKMSEKELVEYKRDTVGFVWQNNGRNLLPYLSALENVMLPMHLSDKRKKKEKALELLERVGMETKKNSKMSTMSGGVDTRTADVIFDIFTELNKAGQTILIVTHDVALSKKVKRVVAIRDGKISSERILKEKYADRLKEITVDWRNEDTQEEYVIIDKAGRVQIPREILDKMNLRDNKVKLEYQDDKVIIGAPEEI